MPRLLRLLPILVAVLALLAPAALAQSHAQGNRAFVRAPQAAAMGDAAVAFPSLHTAFFYNPAHSAHVAGVRPRITFLGLSAGTTTGLGDQLAFVRGDLLDAVDIGVENLPREQQRALFDEALLLGRRPSDVNGAVLLPSVQWRVGAVGFGAGLFAHTGVRYRFPAGTADIPDVDLVGQGDVMGLVTGAVDLEPLGVPGLSAGLTAKYTRRYLTAKNESFLDLSSDTDVYLYTGGSVGFDLGALYAFDAVLPIPGTLRAGVTAYDLGSSDFGYAFSRNLTENSADDEALIASETEDVNDLYGAARPSYRVGLSYMLPGLPGLLRETGLAVDYLSYTDPTIDQPALARLHLGAQARVAFVALRAGLSQGYPTAGLGLDLGFVHVDYAYYGLEGGRLPGQVPVWNHQFQIVFGML